ncbi:nickel-dependent hydrogenase large subunit [Sessilibacter corallicola]|uniref:nickel-dependent hydrogenase large subunit n=1 Tax=Sessilibacter corallicola TaxID=2904075 RepID=UPI00333F45A8
MDAKGNCISRYQIVVPIIWNFSSRKANKKLSVLENPLERTLVQKRENGHVSFWYVVRSLDLCIVCTVY